MFYLLLVLCCLCLILWRFSFRKQTTLEPPDLSGRLPIVGHGLKLLGDSIHMWSAIKNITKECLEKGGLIKMKLGPYQLYVVADPEDTLTVMNTCLQKHYVFEYAKPFLGNGLITTDVATWKKNRKLLNPAFNQQVLDSFVGIFNSQSQRVVDQFASEVGTPFDHEILLRINNLETICYTSIGVDAGEYADLHKQYLPRLAALLKLLNERVQKFWLHSDFIYNMTSAKKQQDEQLKQILALSTSVVQKKKLERKNLNTDQKPGTYKAFLDLIIDLAHDTGCFTDDQIREETDTIIGGGHDTTASLLTFALTALGSYTDVQTKAYEEILHVLGNSEKNIDKDDLSKLVYLEAILKETIRLHPIVPILARRVDKDVKLKNYTLKANSDIFILLCGVQRHSIWGPDADQFKPERWFDKDTLPDSKYFAAFGMGRRSCIGKVYAMMSMKTTLAYVLRKYRISSNYSNLVEQINLLIRPASGHYITLSPRNT